MPYIKPVFKGFKGDGAHFDLIKFKSKIRSRDIYILTRKLSMLLLKGINIISALSIIKGQIKNKTLKGILNDVYIDLNQGNSLSKALRMHREIPDLLISMIEVSEMSGSLPENMERLSKYYENETKLRSSIKKATSYPAFVGGFSIIALFVILKFIVPKFKVLFDGMEGVRLPIITRILFLLSSIFNNYGLFILPLPLIFLFFYKKIIGYKNIKLKLDKYLTKLPFIGPITRNLSIASFSRSLAMMLKGGVTLLDSIEMSTKVVVNTYIAFEIRKSLSYIQGGERISKAFDNTNIFPKSFIDITVIGEETGDLEDTLIKLEEYYNIEAEQGIEKGVKLVEPLFMLFICLIVGLVVIGIMLPLFKMYEYVS